MANPKSGGLRFLWIPSRKKHSHKGRFDTTNKTSLHPTHRHKKNESWAIHGGIGKGEEELLKTDIAATSGSSTILPITAIGAATLNPNVILEEDDTIPTEHLNGNIPSGSIDNSKEIEPLDEGNNSDTLIIGEKRNGAIKKNNSEINPYTSSNHISNQNHQELPWQQLNTQTDNISNNKSCFQKDLDSIEKLDEIDGSKLGYHDLPDVQHHLTNNRRMDDDDEIDQYDKACKDDGKDEKAVKCLYYALMCCECTIS